MGFKRKRAVRVQCVQSVVGYVFLAPTFAGPFSIGQLSSHMLWGWAVRVERYFLESKLMVRAPAREISQPPERGYKGWNRLLATAPERPVEIWVRPPPMVGVRCGPCNTVVCPFFWRMLSPVAGFIVSGSGKVIEGVF